MSQRPIGSRTRAAAVTATAAADALTAWLRDQPRKEVRPPLVDPPAAGEPHIAAGAAAGTPSLSLESVAPSAAVAVSEAALATPSPEVGGEAHAAPLWLAHTDWLYHRLTVAGPVTDLARFRAAAAGAGTVPWHLDLDRMAEDIFHLLAAPPARAGSPVPPVRSLSLAGARILADQLCAAAARRQALAVARVGASRACPFDLQALLPVPPAVLRLGPDDPAALGWLWTHWGTTQPLRHVVEAVVSDAARREQPTTAAAWVVTFWSADWTPWRALVQMTARWPALRFEMRPLYTLP
jgi:hypothetical protein